jgi:Tol biopolymer transport system component
VWTPDGQRLTFTSTRDNASYSNNLYWIRSDLTGEVQRLTTGGNVQIAGSWHPAGRVLAFSEVRGQTALDIMLLPMEGSEAEGWKPGQPTVFLSTTASEMDPAFSPDGRWLAYTSNQGGQQEVFVRPFPGPGGERQVSTSGGVQPAWSPTGVDIFFRSLDQHIMKVAYKADGANVQVSTPVVWSEEPLTPRSTDVLRGKAASLHPDGQRFAVLMDPGERNASKADEVSFIFNFFDELRRLTSAH